jgi:hypothetical protein
LRRRSATYDLSTNFELVLTFRYFLSATDP